MLTNLPKTVVIKDYIAIGARIFNVSVYEADTGDKTRFVINDEGSMPFVIDPFSGKPY